jgi:phosphonate transport system ATP-binding protein
MNASVIALHDLQVRFEGRTVLSIDQLLVRAGERVAVVGPNGAGKSTLVRCLGGSPFVGQGRVQVLGRALQPTTASRPSEASTPTAQRAWRAQVGQLMQGLNLVGRLSVLDNVLIGALARVPGWRSWLRRYPPALVIQAHEALALVGLVHLAHQRVDALSGGERQRVALARLRMQAAALVLADEPTSQLDPSASRQACQWLTQAAAGATLITVVHDTSLLPLLATRVWGLRAGELVFDLPVERVDATRLHALYAPPTPASELHSMLEATIPFSKLSAAG